MGSKHELLPQASGPPAWCRGHTSSLDSSAPSGVAAALGNDRAWEESVATGLAPNLASSPWALNPRSGLQDIWGGAQFPHLKSGHEKLLNRRESWSGAWKSG